jgi:glucose-1-phosphate adenylyltransferase
MKAPAKTLYDELHPERPEEDIEKHDRRIGHAINSLISLGTIISGARISRSVIGSNVRIHSFAVVENSVIFDNVDIGKYCRIKNTIIDKSVHVPDNIDIGYDKRLDHKRGFHISPKDIVVVPKEYKFLEEKNKVKIEKIKKN